MARNRPQLSFHENNYKVKGPHIKKGIPEYGINIKTSAKHLGD